MFHKHKKLISLKCCAQICIHPLSEHFSFAKIIHPLDRCGISIIWLNSMIITQVHLVLCWTIKDHCKMCICHTTQCHRCLKLREHAIVMLTCRMSTRAVAKEFNVYFSNINLQHLFVFENLAVRPTGLNRRPRLLRHVGERFADVNVVNSASPVVVGLWYGQA